MNRGPASLCRQGMSLLVLAATLSTASASDKISLPTNALYTRADIYVQRAPQEARGTLVLCPGRNGNGEDLIENPKWVAFAKEQNLNLVGLSFASNDDAEDRGYFEVSSGSGQALLEGLNRALGSKQPPILIYGMSRGAQFTYSFAHWKPELVLAWCAYSATKWEVPEKTAIEPKGMIACGDEDEPNYSFSVLQFLKGRSMEKPWTWVSLSHTRHVSSLALDDLVRAYFSSVLKPQKEGLWLDVDTKTPVATADLKEHPTLAVWLPDEQVAQEWKSVHQP